MRRLQAVLATVLVGVTAAVIATGSSAGGRAKTASLAIPLPPAGGVHVSVVTVTVTAPPGKHVGALKVVATNASDLGTPQTNTQAVIAVAPKSSPARKAVFKVWVFIHHWPAAPARHQTAVADTATANLDFEASGNALALGTFVASLSCDQLKRQESPKYELIASRNKMIPAQDTYYFLGDSSVHEENGVKYDKTKQPFLHLGNLVITNDTPTEEQLDNSVYSKGCPGAEDPANDPPPV